MGSANSSGDSAPQTRSCLREGRLPQGLGELHWDLSSVRTKLFRLGPCVLEVDSALLCDLGVKDALGLHMSDWCPYAVHFLHSKAANKRAQFGPVGQA